MAFPILHFRDPLEWLVEVRYTGWYDGVTVEVENGSLYPVFFYDPVRLSQDLKVQLEGIDDGWGKPFIAEPRMIVVAEITEENIRTAIDRLYAEGWFENA